MRAVKGWLGGLGWVAALAACQSGKLIGVSGSLAFSSPDQPASVIQPDGGLVEVEFGQVVVGSTKSLKLAVASLGTTATLGALTAVQPDPEFGLPFVDGSIVNSTPSQITATFEPTSVGQKTAVFRLAYDAPGAATITLECSGVGAPNGLVISPNPVDFGAVELNQTQSVPITITNIRELPATLTLSPLQGADAKSFTLGAPSAGTIAPYASVSLRAAFAPLVLGNAGGSFTVNGWIDSPPVTVTLTALGVQSWVQASPLDFGFVQPHDKVVKSAQVTNIGSYRTLNLVPPAPSISQPTGLIAFSLGGGQPALPVALAPGQSASFPVAFAPTSLGAFTGSLFVSTDDPGAPYAAVSLEGYGGGPRIRCSPQLSFGPTPVGYPFAAPAVCTNIGADIPSHPEIKLEISGSGISTDTPSFSAILTLPDSGAAGPGDDVGLSSGQSAAIQVTFMPEDAGLYDGRLTVASNDLYDGDAGTILAGEGTVLGPCSILVVPGELAFGNVPPASVGTLAFQVENTGQSLCAFSYMLDPTSAAGFSIVGGDRGEQILSYSGDTDNPAGHSSQATILVQFTSSGPLTAAAGTIDLTAPTTSPPERTIALTASSAYGCFTVAPKSFDFGTQLFGQTSMQLCTPASTTFTGVNGCGAPIVISGVDLASSADGGSPFTLMLNGSPPFVLDAGAEIAFPVAFTPGALGPESGTLLVTSSDARTAPTAAAIKGDAELGGPRTDTFIVPAAPKLLDIIWVLDVDDDEDQVQSVAALMPQLIDALNQAQIDWQMAVTSTDTCDLPGSDQGSFEPCEHCFSNISSLSSPSDSPLYVASTTADAGDVLASLFSPFGLNLLSPDDPCKLLSGGCDPCHEANGTYVNGDEHFFDSIADALSPQLLGGHNSGFLRPDADLAIVVVNGDDEDDAWQSGDAGYPRAFYLTSLAQITALLQGLKSDAGMVSVSYVNDGAGAFKDEQRMGKLVTATNGTEIDTSQISVWQNALIDLFSFGGGSQAFRLSEPALASSIGVSVNGAPVLDWSYDVYEQSIVFFAGGLPVVGATVTVTYESGCQ